MRSGLSARGHGRSKGFLGPVPIVKMKVHTLSDPYVRVPHDLAQDVHWNASMSCVTRERVPKVVKRDRRINPRPISGELETTTLQIAVRERATCRRRENEVFLLRER